VKSKHSQIRQQSLEYQHLNMTPWLPAIKASSSLETIWMNKPNCMCIGSTCLGTTTCVQQNVLVTKRPNLDQKADSKGTFQILNAFYSSST